MKLDNKYAIGLVTGSFSTIVFIIFSIIETNLIFLSEPILFACSCAAIMIVSFKQEEHVCKRCGEVLKPLPVKYEKHFCKANKS